MMTLHTKRWLALFIAVLTQVLLVMACQGNVSNMTVGGVPKFVCPSSTPRPTDIPLPTDAPTYPQAFQVNLNYYYTDSNRTWVDVQYLAQNVGMVYLSWSGVLSGGYWPGGTIPLTNTGNYAGVQSSFRVYFPSGLIFGQITVSSSLPNPFSFTVTGYNTPVFSNPFPPPCCLPPPIYPTPRPTFTPYPTPTSFEVAAPSPFFLEDPIYNRAPPIQLKLRMKAPVQQGLLTFIIPLFAAASWTLEITNVGQTEYDFLGAGYTYVAEVETGGVLRSDVWPPSHQAATFLGITEQAYGPLAIQPGQTITAQVAAWIPVNARVSKLAMLINPYHSGDPGWATFTPGSGKDAMVIYWMNALNTVCTGEIAYP